MLRQGNKRARAVLMTAAAVLPLTMLAFFASPTQLADIAERAALISAMASMPQGSLMLFRERFADKVDESYYSGDGSSSAPFPEPYEEAPEPPAPSASPEPDSGKDPSPAAGKRPPIVPPSPAKDTDHPIPEKYEGRVVQENMAGKSGGSLIPYESGFLRNYTKLGENEISSIMEQGMNIELDDTDEPQVLLFHTHATESYEPYDSKNYDMRNSWRSTDNNINMVAVGNALEAELKKAGIGVVHDTTQHDYPSYNGAYERSAATINSYLKKYPSIKIAIDVHRDAIQREDDLIVKPVVEIDGKKAAQLMIITGSEDGTMNVPEWRENLRFAAQVQNAIEQDWPHLTRPIFFCYRKYNMDLTTGSLLFEVGSNANTLDECVYTAQLVGRSLAKLLGGNVDAEPTKATAEAENEDAEVAKDAGNEDAENEDAENEDAKDAENEAKKSRRGSAPYPPQFFEKN